MGTWRSYLAVGDSFTEGVGDPGEDGACRGWADRTAELLATRTPGLRYANLAVRGLLMADVVERQVPAVDELRPDLVTFAAGGNDVLRPRCDIDRLAELARSALGRLTATGADVVVFTGFDPRGLLLLGRLRRLIEGLNDLLRDAANEHGCRIVDLWSMRVLQDRRAWTDDRLHLSAEGHRRVALHVAEVLGLPVEEDWRTPWPDTGRRRWADERRDDVRWAREHLFPWLSARARRRPPGHGRTAKRPEMLPFTPSAAQASSSDA